MTVLISHIHGLDARAVTSSPQYVLVKDVVFKRPSSKVSKASRRPRGSKSSKADHAALVKLAEANTRRLTGKSRF